MAGTEPVESTDYEQGRIIERPDGFYWQPLAGGRERGPFPTLAEALDDMQGAGEEEGEDVEEAVRDAEETLGVPDWVDPETGELADDERTRIEDH